MCVNRTAIVIFAAMLFSVPAVAQDSSELLQRIDSLTALQKKIEIEINSLTNRYVDTRNREIIATGSKLKTTAALNGSVYARTSRQSPALGGFRKDDSLFVVSRPQDLWFEVGYSMAHEDL